MKEPIHARLTIYDAAKMTSEQRKRVAAWLRGHARDVLREGDDYAPRFVGRLMKLGRRPRA